MSFIAKLERARQILEQQRRVSTRALERELVSLPRYLTPRGPLQDRGRVFGGAQPRLRSKPPPSGKSRPKISGNWVAFLELQADGKDQVALHDLGAGTTTLLTSGAGVSLVATSGDWLLWSGANLTARRLSTGETTTVPISYDVACMDVSGDWLVMRSAAFALPDGRIVARNLVTQQEIAADGDLFAPEMGLLGCPSISGTLVGYTRLHGSSLYGMAPFPYYRDFMVPGSPTRITHDATTYAENVDVSGDRIVWQDQRENLADQIWTHTR